LRKSKPRATSTITIANVRVGVILVRDE